jgi:hypothetical protein
MGSKPTDRHALNTILTTHDPKTTPRTLNLNPSFDICTFCSSQNGPLINEAARESNNVRFANKQCKHSNTYCMCSYFNVATNKVFLFLFLRLAEVSGTYAGTKTDYLMLTGWLTWLIWRPVMPLFSR